MLDVSAAPFSVTKPFFHFYCSSRGLRCAHMVGIRSHCTTSVTLHECIDLPTYNESTNKYIYIYFFIYTYTYKTVIVLIITCYARDKYDIYTCGEYTNRYPEDPIGRFVAKAAQHRQNTLARKWFDNNLNSS